MPKAQHRRRSFLKIAVPLRLSLKADNGGHPRCDTQLPAACCPGALHAAVCKQASSQRPVLSAQTMQRYSARINAFILLQTYYNSRRGVSQAFDSPARLVLHWAKMQPGGFIMQLITERLFSSPCSPMGCASFWPAPPTRSSSSPTPICWTFPLSHPRAVGLVHRMGALPERFRRLGRRPLLQGPARKRPAGNWLRPAAGI